MTGPSPTPAPKGAAGTYRKRRRQQGGRRPEWVRPFRRARRALESALRLIESTVETVEDFESSVGRRPVRTARRLTGGVRQLATAGQRLVRASRELAEATESFRGAPEPVSHDVPKLLERTSRRWQAVSDCLQHITTEVVQLQAEVLCGLASGELVPEHPSDSRPRIVLVPRQAPVRAFLALRRRPRVADRISAVLRRRRRALRPAALTVPPRTCQGRAPPLSSTAAL